MMWTLISGIWGQAATAIVGIATVFAALFGLRYSVRKTQRMEIAHEQQERTLERIAIKEKMEARVGNMSDNDVLERLRDKGYIRD